MTNNQFAFNERIRQVVLFIIIIFLTILCFLKLDSFMPGILGALTLYIVSRKSYLKLIYQKKWKKGVTAWLFMLGFVLLIAVPIYFSITLVSPKIAEITSNPDAIVAKVKGVMEKLEAMVGFKLSTGNSLNNITQKVTGMLPGLLNSTLSVLTNLITMFFLLYYMLTEGHKAERSLSKIIPLKNESIQTLAKETRSLVRANAIGIPLISVIQGVTASIGYWIFGVENWGMWGFVTGVFAFFPVVGTMIVWVPLVISMFAQGDNNTMAIGLTLYSLIVTGNVDYLARMSLMKRMGDVHPLITVFGVIIGLNLFGFIGLVFGPLLLSYLLILVKIYVNEFSASKADIALFESKKAEIDKEAPQETVDEPGDTILETRPPSFFQRFKNLLGGKE